MAGKAVAVDPGSHTWKVLQAKDTKHGLSIQRFGAVPAGDGAAGLAGLGVPLQAVVAGLAGRDMTLRYTQVPPSPDWQLRSLMDLEIQDIAGQSGGELSADYNLLPVSDEESGMDTVLMALARNDALERVSSVVTAARGTVGAHVPNCVALYNAYLRTAPIDDDDQVVCLANIGRDTTDIALLKGQDLLFARNLSSGSKVLDDAIASAFGVSERKAESLKRDLLDLDPASRGRYASGQAEKVTTAAGGAGSALVSAIQSSVAFCQSQTKIQGLQLDKVLIAGGGARLRGLRGMLREALRCPVEIFDPFDNTDLSALPEEEAAQLQEMRSEAVVALGLAIGAMDSEVYSLEILPDSVKRKQRFVQRTIYNIGACVIGAALLGLAAVQGKVDVAASIKAQQVVVSQARRVKKTDADAAEVVAQNAVDRSVAGFLAERATPLSSVVRTMRALHEPGVMPPELWITSIEVVRGGRSSRGGRNRGRNKPQVKLHGSIRPIMGRDVGAVYQKFLRDFRAHELIPGRQVVPEVDDPSAELRTFVFTIDFIPEPEAREGEGDQ